MAKMTGLYDVLRCPEENGIYTAKQLILPLEQGIARLKATPDKFKELNPANGYGSYDSLVCFCETILDDCCNYPDAVIEADR